VEFEQIELFGIAFSNITFEEVRRFVSERVRDRKPGFAVTPNVDHICLRQRNPEFRAAYDNASLVLADGMPILWASRIMGKPLCEKLSGSDLVPLLCEYAADHGYSVFLFGGRDDVPGQAADALLKRHPGLKVAGTYSPPMLFERDPELDAAAVRRIREAKPDICFVALGSPRQEIWLDRHFEEAGVPMMFGIGASLDFVAGRVRRAPRWMQRSGLEWAWRVAIEPRRLWRRYLVEDLLFFKLLWQEFRRSRLGRKGEA
jgi:N-acetylglucosaminyldiphosphoundecaprenol N-acetyl-beta-D-mannosaminyltransferase